MARACLPYTANNYQSGDSGDTTIIKKRPRKAQLGIKDYGADAPESSQKQEGVVRKRPSGYDHHLWRHNNL